MAKTGMRVVLACEGPRRAQELERALCKALPVFVATPQTRAETMEAIESLRPHVLVLLAPTDLTHVNEYIARLPAAERLGRAFAPMLLVSRSLEGVAAPDGVRVVDVSPTPGVTRLLRLLRNVHRELVSR